VQLAYVIIYRNDQMLTMSTKVRIKLSLPLLVEHLSREERRPVPESEVLQWLVDARFTRDGDYWIVSEADLGQVEPSEVLEIEPLDK
jgi:hypothetical protein